jgi:hypothetical protein
VPYRPGALPTSTTARSFAGSLPVLLISCAVTAMTLRGVPSAAGTNDRWRPETTRPSGPARPPAAANTASACRNRVYARPPAPAVIARSAERRLIRSRSSRRVLCSAYSCTVPGPMTDIVYQISL